MSDRPEAQEGQPGRPEPEEPAGPASAAPGTSDGSAGPFPGGEQPARDERDRAEVGEAGPHDGGSALLADAASLAAERDEYLDALQRLKADFDNYRKRVQRQQEEQTARAALDLVSKLLPVLDTLDLAEAHLRSLDDPESAQDAKALSQARGQLMEVLAKEGLERVDQTEVLFDPVVHDAVAHAPVGDDAGEQGGAAVVDEVLRSGYRWQGQVLRAAMVRVRG